MPSPPLALHLSAPYLSDEHRRRVLDADAGCEPVNRRWRARPAVVTVCCKWPAPSRQPWTHPVCVFATLPSVRCFPARYSKSADIHVAAPLRARRPVVRPGVGRGVVRAGEDPAVTPAAAFALPTHDCVSLCFVRVSVLDLVEAWWSALTRAANAVAFPNHFHLSPLCSGAQCRSVMAYSATPCIPPRAGILR